LEEVMTYVSPNVQSMIDVTKRIQAMLESDPTAGSSSASINGWSTDGQAYGGDDGSHLTGLVAMPATPGPSAAGMTDVAAGGTPPPGLDTLGRLASLSGPVDGFARGDAPASLQLASGSRGINCSAPPISPDEAAAAARGDRSAFWSSRAYRGDPLGDTALSIVNNSNFSGQYANLRLRDALSSRSPHMSPDQISAEANQIGVELMREHVKTVGSPGTFTPSQISNYHNAVFARHGLAPSTFGGAMVSGTPLEAEVTSPWWYHCR
jgi:hypothetical protein